MIETKLEREILVFAAICYLFIGILGTFGNCVAIVALRTSKAKNTSTSLLISNISLAILPLCILVMPFFCAISVEAVLLDELSVTNGTFEGFFVFMNICSFVELNTIAILAFNRACAMAKPSFYRKHLTKYSFTMRLLIFVWIYSTLIWIPIAFGVSAELKTNMEEFFVEICDERHIMDTVLVFLCFVLPFNIAFVSHIVLFIHFRRTRNKAPRANMTEKPAWESHVTRTMTGVFLLLIICSVPHIIVHVLKRFGNWPRFSVFAHILYFFRLCLDPFVYILASRKYRDDFLRVLKFRRFQRNLTSNSAEKTSTNKQIPACLNTVPLMNSSDL